LLAEPRLRIPLEAVRHTHPVRKPEHGEPFFSLQNERREKKKEWKEMRSLHTLLAALALCIPCSWAGCESNDDFATCEVRVLLPRFRFLLYSKGWFVFIRAAATSIASVKPPRRCDSNPSLF
jgi:hypothetical protein